MQGNTDPGTPRSRIVLGIGSSHTPMLNAALDDWPRFVELDRLRPHRDKSGRPVTYDQLLAIAGDGPAQRELRAQIDRLGIGSRVHWIGRPREEELPGLMSASTLLAVPALDDSVRGQHIPRAMASGLCVIASEKPALAGLLEHEQTGLVARAGDLPAWIDALRRASMSPDARRRWSQRARERAERELAWTQVARRIEGMCLGACGEGAVVQDGAQTPQPG
jgi:glycosyltransferase involved in cell wall biosynthesis